MFYKQITLLIQALMLLGMSAFFISRKGGETIFVF